MNNETKVTLIRFQSIKKRFGNLSHVLNLKKD
jgi:hypothetical protein